MKQSEIFLKGEGLAWLDRNRSKLNEKHDPVLNAIAVFGIKPTSVFEVGCANGWRLEALKTAYNCYTYGIDPGIEEKTWNLRQGTAESLQALSGSFDTVIYGFCLYLCDPEDYFKIVAEGDRILRDDGHLIVYDFCTELPYKLPYKHKKGIFSHHYDFSKLWLSHPAYTMFGRTVQNETCVTILKKNLKNAFPVEE